MMVSSFAAGFPPVVGERVPSHPHEGREGGQQEETPERQRDVQVGTAR